MLPISLFFIFAGPVQNNTVFCCVVSFQAFLIEDILHLLCVNVANEMKKITNFADIVITVIFGMGSI